MKAIEARARRLLFERSDGACERCSRYGTEYDHRMLRSQIPRFADQWNVSNALALCRSCHARKHRDLVWAETRGYYVRSFNDPLLVPVKRLGVMVFLDDEGGFRYADS